ncbi:MAG: hypothetical protein Q7K65_03100 [Candidatus Buchananbacteria bacterium]|nr:hypothetical protein [Candidatus Buchananbacteria bacterium]
MTNAVNPVLAKQFDITELDRRSEYNIYFSEMIKLFELLMKCYQLQADGGNLEAKIVKVFLDKLLCTMEALKMKYYFNTDHFLKIDLIDSGFPNHLEIESLGVDLEIKADKLGQLPTESVLRRVILDRMLTKSEEPVEELLLMSNRSYLEMLDSDSLFFIFTPGEITLMSTKPEYRSYTFSWAYWDFSTNCPYINIMTFHQDIKQEPLEEKGLSFYEFMAVIRSEGSRACDVGILAMIIDEQIESIHPKIIKRIGLGPLYSRFLTNSDNVAEIEYCNPVLAQAIIDCGLKDDDFVCLIEDNIVFSDRQKIHSSMLTFRKKVREIFFIPEDDPKCYEKRASVVHRYALMPHALFQYLSEGKKVKDSGLADCKILTYDDKEEVYGI